MDVAAQLRDLGARESSGHLDVSSGQSTARIWLRKGRLASVSLSSATPALGMRLVSGGRLSLTRLGAALITQRQNPTMRLGDILVKMGLVDRPEVEQVVWEQTCDRMAVVLGLPDAVATFTRLPSASAPIAGPGVEDVLAAAANIRSSWPQALSDFGGADAVPMLTEARMGELALRPEEWGVLCRVDGRRTLTAIARQAGFTTLEAASCLQALLGAGLVGVPEVRSATPVGSAEPESPSLPVPAVAESPALPAPATVEPGLPALSVPAKVDFPALPAPTPDVPASAVPTLPPVAASAAAPDLFDDPSALLRELSELSGIDTSTRRRTR